MSCSVFAAAILLALAASAEYARGDQFSYDLHWRDVPTTPGRVDFHLTGAGPDDTYLVYGVADRMISSNANYTLYNSAQPWNNSVTPVLGNTTLPALFGAALLNDSQLPLAGRLELVYNATVSKGIAEGYPFPLYFSLVPGAAVVQIGLPIDANAPHSCAFGADVNYKCPGTPPFVCLRCGLRQKSGYPR